IWVAAGARGLFRILSPYESSLQCGLPKFENISYFWSIAKSDDGKFWIGTNDGVLKFNPRNNTYEDLRTLYGKDYQIRRMYTGQKGHLWLATNKGIKDIDLSTGKVDSYVHSFSD